MKCTHIIVDCDQFLRNISPQYLCSVLPQLIEGTQEGNVGIFGFADLTDFWPWFGFSVFALKNCGFTVWCLVQFAGVLQFSPCWGVFRIFLSNAFSVQCIYGLTGFDAESTPWSRAILQFQGTSFFYLYFLSEECMTSLVFLSAVIWVVTAVKQ